MLRRLLVPTALLALAAWAWRSPRLGAFLIRRAFTRGGAMTVARLQPFVPTGVDGQRRIAYGSGSAERLDVWYPAGTTRSRPTVVWVHGGGWVAGSTSDIEPYAKILADEGYTVVVVGYSLAPGTRYPEPLRQVGAALTWLLEHGNKVHVDTDALVLAGDSAGAQVAAQLALVVTDLDYASSVGIDPPVAADQLRGVISHCGPQQPVRLQQARGVGGWFVRTVGRAYFATGSFDAPRVREASVADHVGPDYPPTLITGGNADPLTPQGRAFAENLAAAGVDVTTRFWPDDHLPALGHEFQFDLNLDEGREVLEATRDFLARVTIGRPT